MVKPVWQGLGIGLSVLIAGVITQLPGKTAPANNFAMTCIGTETGNTINFSYRWGSSGAWKDLAVKPDKWQILTWRYDKANQNSSPSLYIRYDADFSSGTRFVNDKVESYASPLDENCEDYGKTYNFYDQGNTLELVSED